MNVELPPFKNGDRNNAFTIDRVMIPLTLIRFRSDPGNIEIVLLGTEGKINELFNTSRPNTLGSTA